MGTDAGPSQIGVELRPIFPNPASRDAFLVLLSPSVETVRVRTIDVLGRTIASAQHEIAGGRTVISILASRLPSGRYLVVVDGAFGAIATPLTVSR